MIIAVKEKEGVVFGYTNRQSLASLALKDYVDEENVPMGFFKNGNAFSFSILNRQSDIFCYDEEFLKMEPTPKSIVREIIPYIKAKLIENGCANEEGSWKNALVISDGEHIYGVDTEFNFYEVEDFATHSFSSAAIKSCLDATKDMDAEKRIVCATVFLEDVYGDQLFPIAIMDVKSKERKCVYKGADTDEYSFSI